MVSHDSNKKSTPNSTPKHHSSTPRYIACKELSIKALKPKQKRTDYWFIDRPGFGIRVTPKGTKSFVYVYSFANKKFRLTIGQYPKISLREALKKYNEAQEKIEFGFNPVEKERVNKSRRITVKEAINLYEEYGITKGVVSIQEQVRALRLDLQSRFGDTIIQDMESCDFEDVLMSVIKRGSAQMANHVYSYMHRMCAVLTPKYLKFNPISALERPAKTRSRTRALTFSEIHTLWYSLPRTPIQIPIQLALKFILVTVQRGKDIRLMKIQEYNSKDKIWTVPEPKNGREWRVPLNRYAIEIIETLRLLKPGVDHLFSLRNGDLMGKDTLSQSVAKQRSKISIEHFTPHDLRRTAATIITSVGCPQSWASLLLNHTDSSVTSIYDQYAYDYEKRIAIDILEFVLERILECENVEDVPTLDEMRELVRQANLLRRN
ncbi:MAG: site-specific integrase [Ekhidna sp.]|nr:site-specific integrase [Ekhidna sp.]